MNNEKFKKLFLDILCEPEIIQKIKEIVRGDEVYANALKRSDGDAAYRQEIMRLREELENMKSVLSSQESAVAEKNKIIENFNSQIVVIKNENQRLQQRYATEVDKNRHTIESLQKENDTLRVLAVNFHKPLSLYQEYTTLNSELKKNLLGIISHQTPIAFISSLSRYENLESLWEYIKYLIGSGNGGEVPVLKEIFEFFFLLMNDSSETPVYALSEVKIGSRYDDDLHIRGYDSAAQGTVREVQLTGYYSVNTGNIVKKSVVRAE